MLEEHEHAMSSPRLAGAVEEFNRQDERLGTPVEERTYVLLEPRHR